MPENTEDRQFTVEWLNRGNILPPSTFVALYSQQNSRNGWYEFKDGDNKVVFAANPDEIRCISSQPVDIAGWPGASFDYITAVDDEPVMVRGLQPKGLEGQRELIAAVRDAKQAGTYRHGQIFKWSKAPGHA